MSGRGRTFWMVGLVAVGIVTLGLLRSCGAEQRETSAYSPKRPAIEPDHANEHERRARPEVESPGVVEPSAPRTVDHTAAELGEESDGQEPKRPHTLIIRASGQDGIAAIDADVQVWGSSPWGSGLWSSGVGEWELDAGEAEPQWTARTGAAGVARVEIHRVERVQIRVANEEFLGVVERAALAKGDVTELLVTVKPAFWLSGVIQRSDGRVVAGAAVYLAWLRIPSDPHHIAMVRSDENGRFVFPAAAVPDAPTLRVYAMGPSEPGAWVDFPARRGRIENVVVTVDPATFVTGRCVDEEGRPIRGVRVRGIFPMTGEITFTNAGGHFSMKVPDRGGLIFWVKGRVQSGLRNLRGQDGKLDVGDVLIPKGGVLAGRVVTAKGEPAFGAEVLICDPITVHAAHKGRLDEEGRFRSDLIGPGNHMILIRTGLVPGRDGAPCWFIHRGYFAGATGIEITVSDGIWARVTVAGDTSEPVSLADARVDVRPLGDPGYVIHQQGIGKALSGGFDVQFPGTGRYLLTLHLPASGNVVETELSVRQVPDQVFELLVR